MGETNEPLSHITEKLNLKWIRDTNAKPSILGHHLDFEMLPREPRALKAMNGLQ